ncbi:hypothetical protein DD924_15425, partial [Staphylococcus pseudintermedius]
NSCCTALFSRSLSPSRINSLNTFLENTLFKILIVAIVTPLSIITRSNLLKSIRKSIIHDMCIGSYR